MTTLPGRPDEGALVVPPPPEAAAVAATPMWMSALPALGGLGSIGLLALAPRSPFVYIAGGFFLVTTLGMVVALAARGRAQRRESAESVRRRYLADLSRFRDALAEDDARHCSADLATIDGGCLRVTIGDGAADRRPALVVHIDEGADLFCATKASLLVERRQRVGGVPLQIVVPPVLTVQAASDDRAGLLRHVVAQVLQSPSCAAVRVAVLTEHVQQWRMLLWAPHHRHPHRCDDTGPLRLVAASSAELTALLDGVGAAMLVVDDRPRPECDVDIPATWLLRAAHQHEVPTISYLDGVLSLGEDPQPEATPRLCSPARLEGAARAAAAAGEPGDRLAEFPGVATTSGPLSPVIGTAAAGGPLVLDLREAGEGGIGPHGLLIGATGSGKSELLRLVVSRLLQAHSPAELTMAFVDFKGGATFAPFEGLPHVAASITNLEDDAGLVARAQQALSAELTRRQRVIKQHGAASIAGLGPRVLPRLLVIVDEFSELLVQQPEMIDVLAQIGRLGRSLGVHLLVASQRLDEGRLKGLDSHLSYRIALRCQSAAESRAVIGSPLAAELPMTPGHGYLAVGGQLTRFTAGYSGSPERPANTEIPDRTRLLRYANGPEMRAVSRPDGVSILEAAVAAARGASSRARPIWVPPPTRSPTLDELYGDLQERPGRGFGSVAGERLVVPVGWVDRPDRQSIDTWRVDLRGGSGHIGIAGATRSGVSCAAHALLLSLALRSTPEELHLYLVDLSGGGLGTLARLPHVGAAASQLEQIRAVIGHVARLVDERERAPGRHPDVFLAVDGMARLRVEHEDLEAVLIDIARRGLRVNVHLLCTAHRWLDLRAQLRDQLGSRIELRLGDPIESEIDRRAAALVPLGRPGHGIGPDGRPLILAHAATTRESGTDLVATICRMWSGPRAPGLPRLPAMITPANIAPEVLEQGLCIAVERATLGAVTLAVDNPFLLIAGDPGSGRTSVLRSIGRQDAARGARLVVLDPRRTLLDDLSGEAVLGHAPTPAAATEAVAGLVSGLQRRMPPAAVTSDELRERSWWSGPQLHLIVDDYDLLTLAGATLAPLRQYLPYAADIGLRVSIVRRAAGLSRALYDETLSVLRDLGATGLVLSNAGDEGPILGVRAMPQPPGRGTIVVPGRPSTDVQAVVVPGRGSSPVSDRRGERRGDL